MRANSGGKRVCKYKTSEGNVNVVMERMFYVKRRVDHKLQSREAVTARCNLQPWSKWKLVHYTHDGISVPRRCC